MQGNPTIIDIEASGFGSSSYPIEIGVALADGLTACYLIRPPETWVHWDRNSEHLHHLTRERLLQNGRTPEDVARELNQLLKAQTVYSDAWGFDQTWLSRLFEHAGVRQQFKLGNTILGMAFLKRYLPRMPLLAIVPATMRARSNWHMNVVCCRRSLAEKYA